jgi:hypothetical protein
MVRYDRDTVIRELIKMDFEEEGVSGTEGRRMYNITTPLPNKRSRGAEGFEESCPADRVGSVEHSSTAHNHY